ncbi:MAG: LemA family protein [Bacteroidetes bacterium]|nr:LemA family protein [Bacteroidota bacterium]
MNTRNLTLIIILAVILIFGGCACSGYNGLVNQDENVKKAWNNVQSDYQQRADLVPNLVNTVKGAANFEQTTLTNVIEARAKATQVKIDVNDLSPEKIAQFQAAQSQLSGALGRLLAVSENYPTLKATEGFQQLQKQLEGIENGIRNSRNNFNAAVNDYNVKVRSFPMNTLAGIFGFKAKQGFTAEPGSDKAPEVKF